jgi:formate hydrogenlyase subunit 3/multisubunit Na+/H+ antiporter MnhD subunit
MFFILFELTTLPIFFIILLYGAQPEITEATYYFVSFSLIRGLPLFLIVRIRLGIEGR